MNKGESTQFKIFRNSVCIGMGEKAYGKKSMVNNDYCMINDNDYFNDLFYDSYLTVDCLDCIYMIFFLLKIIQQFYK